MGLLEDLNSGKYNLVLFGILFIFMFHQYWCASSVQFARCKDNKEPMADVSNDIKEAVKQVYLADVEAIRNLSEVATKINAGTFVFPGNLTVSGQIKANGEISNNSQSLASLNSKIDSVNSSLNSSINIINSKIDSIDSKVNSNKTTYDNFINNIAIRKDKQYVIANSGGNVWVNATLSNRPNWSGSSGLIKIEDM